VSDDPKTIKDALKKGVIMFILALSAGCSYMIYNIIVDVTDEETEHMEMKK